MRRRSRGRLALTIHDLLTDLRDPSPSLARFTYDPDVVYGASFFTDACDLNTFNLSLGPVSLNIARWFKTMPVRYTLRAKNEEPVFCTISFQLVD